MITGDKCKSCGHADYDHDHKLCFWKRHGALLACYCTGYVAVTDDARADSMPHSAPRTKSSEGSIQSPPCFFIDIKP